MAAVPQSYMFLSPQVLSALFNTQVMYHNRLPNQNVLYKPRTKMSISCFSHRNLLRRSASSIPPCTLR
eukprot:NODE_2187_length_386_cov_88.374517_g2177_i0.p2 GENE.NODE_2187_length_386_cov_88.374517_g2177_i0~~NODE_2187_length_386_cov_88.374517_g2177_i0.p2  ORF type:complete len:68 (-),score=10.43 NODE_2187_length_386_cov_88.374517_g2177_i0:5-208(-)